uniref:Uncharacterized protein n=1 Tax=Ditylenchus dipsaci TaxID=166011 RepID=A0A915DEW1_9BILA
MTRLCGMLETSEEEERPRIVLPTRAVPTAPPPADNIRNDLCLYRERILNEAMRRRLLEAEREEENMQESDKENTADANRSTNSRKRLNSQMSTDCCDYTLEGTSTNNLRNNNYMGFSELDDGIASADDGHARHICWRHFLQLLGDTDDDALMPMPTTFHSISDIIGYAKVVRAQRNEALGKLNSVIGQFSDALAVYSTSTLRMQDTINDKT